MKKIKTEVFKPPLVEDQITEKFDKQSIDSIPDSKDLTQEEIKKLEKLEVESAFVTCNHCKNKVSSSAKFCSICGNRTDLEEQID
ncbi:MAG: zinc ribbon domain-containing protein [Candidatus Heimdallarchaeaceae archaeon]